MRDMQSRQDLRQVRLLASYRFEVTEVDECHDLDRLLFTGGGRPFRPGQRTEGKYYVQRAGSLCVPEAEMVSTPPGLIRRKRCPLADCCRPVNSACSW